MSIWRRRIILNTIMKQLQGSIANYCHSANATVSTHCCKVVRCDKWSELCLQCQISSSWLLQQWTVLSHQTNDVQVITLRGNGTSTLLPPPSISRSCSVVRRSDKAACHHCSATSGQKPCTGQYLNNYTGTAVHVIKVMYTGRAGRSNCTLVWHKTALTIAWYTVFYRLYNQWFIIKCH